LNDGEGAGTFDRASLNLESRSGEMANPDQALQTQLENVQKRTGRSLEELYAVIRGSGLAKHGEIRDMLKRDHGMGHGDANTVVHTYFQAQGGDAPASSADVLDDLYAGPKAALRPIHERLMERIRTFGDFEEAPKKTYVSLRRKKQFATIGPATRTRVDVGLNMKGVEPTSRLTALPPGGMCQYRVTVTDPAEVDAELIGWIREAYDAAG
jgi:hypothetical protein